MRVLCLALLALAAEALVPTHPRAMTMRYVKAAYPKRHLVPMHATVVSPVDGLVSRHAFSMNSEVQSRRNFGASLLAGVVGAGMAKEAQVIRLPLLALSCIVSAGNAHCSFGREYPHWTM